MDRFVDMLAPARPGETPIAALLPATAFVATIVLIAVTRPLRRWPSIVTSWLLGLVFLWAFVVAMTAIHGDPLAAPTFLLPAYALGLVLRCPSRWGILAASDAFAAVLGVVVVGSVVLEALGLATVPYSASASGSDVMGYWLPLTDLLGLEARWAGPFGYPYLAAPLGGFLLVYGLWRGAVKGLVFGAVGAAALLLAGSRTALLAAVVGVAVVLYVGSAPRFRPVARRALGIVVTAALVIAAVALVMLNPGLTGRRETWPVYLDLWWQAPVFGGGEQPIWNAMEAGDLMTWAGTAHNLWLDTSARWGLVGLLLAAGVFLLGLVVCTKAAVKGSGIGVGLILMVLVGGLTDMVFDWRYLTPTMAVFMWAVLLSARPEESVLDAPLRGVLT